MNYSDKQDYIKYTINSAGILLDEEDIAEIYASGHPVDVVNLLVQMHLTCPARKAIEDMQKTIEANRKEIHGYH